MKTQAKITLIVLALAGFQSYGQNLVLNGNFATGDFADWMQSGNETFNRVIVGTGGRPAIIICN